MQSFSLMSLGKTDPAVMKLLMLFNIYVGIIREWK